MKNNVNIRELTPFTMAVVSYKNDRGKYVSRIYEDEVEYEIEGKATKVIEYACSFFCSTLKGRQDGVKAISGITHKAPVPIDPSSGMYFFPTKSPTNDNCSWIAHSHIEEIKRQNPKQTTVFFKNGRSITLNVSYGILVNQIQRTAQVRYLLDNRLK